MKLPEEVRKAQEKDLTEKWSAWSAAHNSAIKETGGAGKTKRVTESGIEDTKNDIMMYSIVEADSPEAAAKVFEANPHLTIPGAWIDVMPMNQLPGMQ